jgi:hypothetical protein
MTEAVPAEQTVEAEKKKRLFHRIPTSLLVTLLGIALTAWLLPAFSKQWDDKQEARKLKAAFAAQIAAATADSLTRSRVVLDGASRTRSGLTFTAATARLGEQWLTERIKIESELRAYADSGSAISALIAYDQTMQTLFLLVSNPWAIQELLAGSGIVAKKLARSLGQRVEDLRADLQIIIGGGARKPSDDLRAARDVVFTSDLVAGVLDEENKLVMRVLGTHIRGYSTTAHDLVHNLIP